jgi:membrane protease YdiL (CAAX protease family)
MSTLESVIQTDPTPSGRRKVRAAAVAVGLLISALIFSTITGVIALIPVFMLELDFMSAPVVSGLLIAGQLGFLVVAYLYARRYDLRVPIALPTRSDLGYTVGGVIAALVVATAVTSALDQIGLLPESVFEDLAVADPMVLIALAVLSVVVIAPVEEYLFRGVIQGRLRRSFGAIGAIFGASLLFGALHVPNYGGTALAIVSGALLIATVGVVFGILYERTANLVVPVTAHAVYNVVLFVGTYYWYWVL